MHYRLNLLTCLLAGASLTGCGPSVPHPVAPPVPVVNVSQPIAKEVVDYEEFTGRTDAVSTVDIRARVNGYLDKVTFKDGDIVKLGALLYQIDPRPFEAALAQALGQVERLEAQKKLLVIQVDRYRELAKKGAGSQQDLDQYLAQQAENVGELKAAQAQVQVAKLNLDFTRVSAPLTGRISRTLITVGNLVAADTTLLTTIRSIDPMYAYFNMEEPAMLRIKSMIRDKIIPARTANEVPVVMGLADDVERKFPLHGTIDFVNNTLDPQTGTIQIRAVFPNAYRIPDQPPVLTPGQFVRIRMPMGPRHRVLLITERALGTDQGQKFVYTVDKSHKVVYRPVRLGLVFDGLQAIESGLEPGDQVVVNGLQRVRPGIEVKAEEVDMRSLTAAVPAGRAPAAAKPADAKPAAPKPAAAAGVAAPKAKS
jgi:RND family efflux transporter MFP subunit